MKRFVHRSPVPKSRYPVLGLTLIELVIVCAIIAVLVGIVWVVMAPAREKARQTVCISNLTQIGHAFRMYRDDWDGIEPQEGVRLEYWSLGIPCEKGTPIYSLQSYLKTRNVWICPSEFEASRFSSSSYYPNYCTHEDVKLFGYKYDQCWLPPIGFTSFSLVVSFIPDWPVLFCDRHHFFYFGDKWHDYYWIVLRLSDLSVRKCWSSEYIIRFPLYWRD